MSNQKTIFMPKALKDKWVEALRSGKYQQGYERLVRITAQDTDEALDQPQYCCLGVLEVVIAGHVVHPKYELSPAHWLIDNQIKFLDSVREVANNPWIDSARDYLANINDCQNKDFVIIADLIESAYGGETYEQA